MRKPLLALLALLWGAMTAVAATQVVPPTDARIQYTGRINFTDSLRPWFSYPGTQICVRYKGSGLAMMAKPGSGYFVVVLDDQSPRKVFFSDADSVLTVASTPQGGKHTVRIVLAYEGYAKRPEFRGFYLAHDTRLLAPPRRPKHRIEFIGNSITCGYGNEAPGRDYGFADSTENHYITYAAIAARVLHAEEMCVARSGIGAYRNYNGRREGDTNTMPQWYDFTNIYDSTQVWDHSSFRPEVICVNLGTNDLSTPNHDVQLYRRAYHRFILHLHEVQPQAQIVMLTGCMLLGKPLDEQRAALDELCAELKGMGLPVHRFDMEPHDGSLGYGASWHPSALQHRKMAGELVPFLRPLLGE